MTKDLGRVVINAATPEEFVEQSIFIASKEGLNTPSVISKIIGGSTSPISFDQEHASLRDLLRFAADAGHVSYREYSGVVILGNHKHPLLTLLQSYLPSSEPDPFQKPE